VLVQSMSKKKCTIYSEKPISDKHSELLKYFLMFCKHKLSINELPEKIRIFSSRSGENGMTTGGYDPSTTDISVLGGNRLFLDILRSIAHELTHHKQNERGNLLQMVSEYDTDLDAPYENEAYERSGNLIKEWTRIILKHKTCPEIYELYY